MKKFITVLFTLITIVTLANLTGEVLTPETQKTAQYYYVITGD